MDVIFRDSYKIKNFISANSLPTLKESIDGTSYVLSISFTETDELKSIQIGKGEKIELYDYEFNSDNYISIFNGIIWDIKRGRKNKTLSLTCKTRTVHIDESEDEYLWSEGQTATQRATQICTDWWIPIGNFPDTEIGLAKDLRKESLYSMMKKDLKETAQKGGKLYKYRMSDSLDLIEIGSNNIVYKLQSITEDIQDSVSLNGLVTQVKVLGKNDNDKATTSPILGLYSQDVEYFGTMQKIVQDSKITDISAAQEKANTLFSTGETSKNINCIQDINILRAGDKVFIDDDYWYITDITHTLGNKGSMDITVMTLEGVRTKFYGA